MIHGSCLCGGIKFTAKKVEFIGSCHCSKCRKRSGGAFGIFAKVLKDNFVLISGEQLIINYLSSDGYGRLQCKVCGCHAPKVKEEEGVVMIPAGLFDDDPLTKPSFHSHTKSKAPWWEITDELPKIS